LLRDVILEIANNYANQTALPLKANLFAQSVRDNGKAALLARGGTDSADAVMLQGIDEGSENLTIVERRKYVRHMKIERNAKAAALAKKFHGTRCQGCGVDFSWIYGATGTGYIEAHHLKPLHTLDDGASVKMDVAEDFAVLCSNCHSMVHRNKPMLTLEQLRSLPGVAFMRKAYQAKFGGK
jgi:5-methylcytosine-specific restriction protein A